MNNYTSITQRTEEFAIRIIKAYGFLDAQPGATRILGKQLLRSGTSIGANVHGATLQFAIISSQVAIKD